MSVIRPASIRPARIQPASRFPLPRATLIAALAALPLVLNGAPAGAQDSMPQPHTQGDVTWVSGGIGEQEMQYMEQIQGAYNLRLLFALQGSGQYLSDVRVTVRDEDGGTVLTATADGPRLFAKLDPGTYRIVAESGGVEQTATGSVPGQGAATPSLYWRSTEK